MKEAVADITEHYTEEEGEGNYSEYSRVNFLVHGDAVSVHNLLEDKGEIVGLNISWWLNSMVFVSLDICCWECLKLCSYSVFLSSWGPKVTDIGSFSLPHVV